MTTGNKTNQPIIDREKVYGGIDPFNKYLERLSAVWGHRHRDSLGSESGSDRMFINKTSSMRSSALA